jgi:mersacidin/lichenicidin family type 2 lantibiotic
MTQTDIVRAWKDPDYRDSITADAGAIPMHPAGPAPLLEDTVASVFGGDATNHILTMACCTPSWSYFTCDPGACSFGCGSTDLSYCCTYYSGCPGTYCPPNCT